MADSISFKIDGLKSLREQLQSVSYDVKRKGGRSALRKAAQLVADKAKAGALLLDDTETGRSIANNIVLRWNGRLFRRTGDLGFRVGVLHGAVLKKNAEKSAGSPTPHWRLIEFGTRKMKAEPFMRRALAEHIGIVTTTFISEYEKAVGRAIRRAARSKGGS
ncbi:MULTISPECIES: HK97-gp10 family putative phage morphogenesis protein [Pseudomonas syringae group]|uniref:HK97-gp10 family putative phage morphogenesis protein n=1 Tax=Pseudomonas syringae group TaxID=136849 RepID=UPI000710049A|nr:MULTISPECIES: HK97-gp10 family putative phage morphogenesis protein [Pseudomonas syringae group]KWS76880.1 hypothetical protein AL052_05470 [Pseudomonas amygdali pv. eriobotryae]MCF5806181.1 hypothetical protein [Pseudomonas tremae]MCF5811221.1 hypothetical protein [Pseudomonas tremae]GFZ70568.1 hypothetical protein PSE10C_13100 [Pseudomonas amygdali pv. eriobotryae]